MEKLINVAQISRQAAKTFSTTLSPVPTVAVAVAVSAFRLQVKNKGKTQGKNEETPVANICSFVIQDCCR